MKDSQASQVWQVIDSTESGDIAALVVDVKVTRRKAYFPRVCPILGPVDLLAKNETTEPLPS